MRTDSDTELTAYWIDYYTPLQPCRCEDVLGPHMLTDLHPDD